MRGPSRRRRTRKDPPPRRAWPAGRQGGGRPPRCPRGRAVARARSRGVDLVVGDEHAPPAQRGRGMHERLRARPAYQTGTRSAAARGMPPRPARPRHRAWQGGRQARQRARPSAHRRSGRVPACSRSSRSLSTITTASVSVSPCTPGASSRTAGPGGSGCPLTSPVPPVGARGPPGTRPALSPAPDVPSVPARSNGCGTLPDREGRVPQPLNPGDGNAKRKGMIYGTPLSAA